MVYRRRALGTPSQRDRPFPEVGARRMAHQFAIQAEYVVADGRYLPFLDGSFVQAFPYSVLQHLSKQDVDSVLPENQAGSFNRRQVSSTDGQRIWGALCLPLDSTRRPRGPQL